MRKLNPIFIVVVSMVLVSSLAAKVFEDAALSYIQQEIRYTQNKLTFSIRRMRIRFCGSLADGKLYYRFEPAFEKEMSAFHLKFAYVDIKYLAPYFTLRVGKFCAPSNLEVYWTWPPNQLNVWINPITRKIWEVGDLFDYGIQGAGTFKLGEEAKLTYIVAALNGKGSSPGVNPDKKIDICGRVNIVPFKGLQIGGWLQLVNAYDVRAADSIDERTLYGIDLWYRGYGLDIRGGYDMGDAGSYGIITTKGDTGKYSGFYIMAGYTFETPVEAMGIGTVKIQPIINYSSYAPDVDNVSAATVITPGVNLYIGENLKVMIDYRMISDPDGAYFASEDNVFEVRTQVMFK